MRLLTLRVGPFPTVSSFEDNKGRTTDVCFVGVINLFCIFVKKSVLLGGRLWENNGRNR